MLLIIIGAGILVAWVYILFLREYLDEHLQGTPYAWWHEEIEDVLWSKSRTILISRGYQVIGWLIELQVLAAAAGVDVNPVVNEVAKLIPEQYRAAAIGLFFIITGLAFAKLRKMSPGYGVKTEE